MQLLEAHPFRVIRDADLEIQELEADDLLETVEQSLSRRRFGSAVALFVNPDMTAHLRELLVRTWSSTPRMYTILTARLG